MEEDQTRCLRVISWSCGRTRKASKELLDVKLERACRVVEVVRLEDRRVEDTDGPDDDVPGRRLGRQDRRDGILDATGLGRLGCLPARADVRLVHRGGGCERGVRAGDEGRAVPDLGGAIWEVGRV